MNDTSHIYDELKPLIANALGIEPEQIHPESVLVRDLGAESIDLLDLSFRLEEHFHVRIETNEIESEAKKRLPKGAYEENGVLTEAALEEIRRALPELDSPRLAKGLRKSDLPSLLTVSFFVRLLERKLADQPPHNPHA